MQLTLPPAVAGEALRYRITRYRLLAGKSQGEAAERIGIKQPTFSAAEAGRSRLSIAQLELLCSFYGREKQFPLLRALREAEAQRGKVDSVTMGRLGDIAGMDLLIGLEYFALAIEAYERNVVTGLLQIEEYARAIIEIATKWQPDVDVDELLQLRMTRQHVLERQHNAEEKDLGLEPVKLAMYIEEDALRRPVGGAEVLVRQLEHLLDVCSEPNVTIRVIPRSVVYHNAMRSPFLLLTLDDNLKVGYVEDFHSSHYYDTPAALDAAGRIIVQLQTVALDKRESRGLISEIRSEIREELER